MMARRLQSVEVVWDDERHLSGEVRATFVEVAGRITLSSSGAWTGQTADKGWVVARADCATVVGALLETAGGG